MPYVEEVIEWVDCQNDFVSIFETSIERCWLAEHPNGDDTYTCRMFVTNLDGDTVLDYCEDFEQRIADWNWDYDMEDEECWINHVQGDCTGEEGTEFAEWCYFAYRVDQCEEKEECLTVVTVNGDDYAGTCDQIEEMFQSTTEEDTTEETADDSLIVAIKKAHSGHVKNHEHDEDKKLTDAVYHLVKDAL